MTPPPTPAPLPPPPPSSASTPPTSSPVTPNRPLRTRIKICGVRTRDAAVCAADSGADAVGFMFHHASPRFIKPEEAWELLASLPPLVTSVGVFVDSSVDAFCDVEERCPTVMSQLHGREDEETVEQCGPNIIKAVRFDETTIDAELARWSDLAEVSAILVDGSAGGEGRTCDWAALAPRLARASKPIFLAGGLTPDNVGEAIRTVRPYGVDVSSGVESARGVKDPQRIRAFCIAVQRADASR